MKNRITSWFKDFIYDFQFRILRKPMPCEYCGVYLVVYPDTKCEGCAAYDEHTAVY